MNRRDRIALRRHIARIAVTAKASPGVQGPKGDTGATGAPGSGGSAAWVEVEVDFGSTPTWDATFTITDAAVSATTEVAVVQSGKAATGRTAGDALWDGITYAAIPASGSFTLHALATPGPVVGKRTILYQLGT